MLLSDKRFLWENWCVLTHQMIEYDMCGLLIDYYYNYTSNRLCFSILAVTQMFSSAWLCQQSCCRGPGVRCTSAVRPCSKHVFWETIKHINAKYLGRIAVHIYASKHYFSIQKFLILTYVHYIYRCLSIFHATMSTVCSDFTCTLQFHKICLYFVRYIHRPATGPWHYNTHYFTFVDSY